ncbi:MAG TPA: VOC family protein [Gammaproteobacteria bacterium]
MHIEHIALWTDDLDRLIDYYVRYFGATSGERYRNDSKGFESCFLTFESGARLEIMKTTSHSPVKLGPGAERMGLTHLAMSVGSEQGVNELTRRLEQDGYPILDGPRRTGDGYYESVTLDPDGNRVEVMV